MAIGALSGLVSIGVQQPLLYFKTISQATVAQEMEIEELKRQNKLTEHIKKIKYELSPLAWYRGGTINITTFSLIIGIQTGASDYFSKSYPLTAPALGGALSSPVVCAVEQVMTTQQKMGFNIYKTCNHILSTHGHKGFFHGFGYTAGREIIYATGYLLGAPRLKKYYVSQGDSDKKAQMKAGLVSGVISGILSQSADYCKTQAQFNGVKVPPSILFSKAAFNPVPLFWRTLGIVIDNTVMPYIQEKMNKNN